MNWLKGRVKMDAHQGQMHDMVQRKPRENWKVIKCCCIHLHATKHFSKKKSKFTKENHKKIFGNNFFKYLNKNVYESQRHYDNEEDGSAGDNNYNGGERNKNGAQQHEHSSWQSFIYHVDVLGEAIDNASYRCSVKERLGRVKFVEEQIMVQFPGSTDVPHG